VFDRDEAIGTFRMVRAHFVLETRWVRDESGGCHVGSMESDWTARRVRPHFPAAVANVPA
jgi:hypothetical protein